MKSMFEKGDYELEVNVKGIRLRHYEIGIETVLTYSWTTKTYDFENATEYEVEQFRKIVRFIISGGKR